MSNAKLYAMPFAKLYSNYVKKAEKKGRTKEEVNQIITWLLGYNDQCLENQMNDHKTLEEMYREAPCINENASLIKGKVCGVQVELVEDEVMRHVHYLDKLIDELAKGKDMEQILR